MSSIKALCAPYVGDMAFYRRVAFVLVPIIIQNTVTNVVSLLDNVMVGRIGTLQMSSVAIVNQLLFVFYLCVFGALSGAGIFAVQYAGAGDNNGIRNCFRMKWWLGAALAAVSLMIFTVFPTELVEMYLSEETLPADAAATLGFALDYLSVMLIGLLPFTLTQVYGTTMREMGQTKIPMLASVAAIFVNLVFNYILIFGNEGLSFLPFAPMGVVGAAIATVMSRFVECAIIVFYCHTHKSEFPFIERAYESMRIPKDLCVSILKKDMPLLTNEFLWSFGVAMLLQCYSVRGLEVVAASNISATVANLFNVFYMSLGSSIAILVGQQLGANMIDDAKASVRRLLALAVVSCIFIGAAMALLAPYIPRIYNTTDEIRAMATVFIRAVAIIMPVLAFTFGCYFTLRAGGKTIITMFFDCGFTWIVLFPTAYTLANFTDIPIIPLYIIVQYLDIIKAAIGLVLIKKGIWVQNIVSE